MDLFRYIVRFLYKIRWYLVILPLIALIVAWFMTRDMERVYDTNTTHSRSLTPFICTLYDVW